MNLLSWPRLTHVFACCFFIYIEFSFLVSSFNNDLGFIFIFNLLYMRFVCSYNPRREFNGLTWVDLGLFLIIFFKIDFFLNFIHQYQVGWELRFNIFCNLFFMGLLWSYNSNWLYFFSIPSSDLRLIGN